LDSKRDVARRLLDRLPDDKLDLVIGLLSTMAGSEAISAGGATVARSAAADAGNIEELPPVGGVHCLLKLGMAKGEGGKLIPPHDTIRCLDEVEEQGQRACLGTRSQEVSESFWPSITRLYVLVGEKIERVIDVARVHGNQTAADLRAREGLSACPPDMVKARTWFEIARVYRVAALPDNRSANADSVMLLKQDKSIAHAIGAGQATFFYVKPVRGLLVERN